MFLWAIDTEIDFTDEGNLWCGYIQRFLAMISKASCWTLSWASEIGNHGSEMMPTQKHIFYKHMSLY